MTIKEMHYDYKQKLNKIDSQKFRGLKVPEIDWKLNEAQELIVKIIAQPRLNSQVGFEVGQRTIDDIRTIVLDQKPSEYLVAKVYDESSYIVGLPDDYWFLAKTKIIASKGDCKNVLLYDSKPVQHDDNSESSMFDKSSFEWRTANYRFNREGIRVFTDTTFIIDKVGLEYLIKPEPMYNAEDWTGGSYKTLNGKVYTGTKDCGLPEGIHRSIVDLAVMLTANDLNLPDYQLKQNKVKISTE